jgi:hypothetical protein
MIGLIKPAAGESGVWADSRRRGRRDGRSPKDRDTLSSDRDFSRFPELSTFNPHLRILVDWDRPSWILIARSTPVISEFNKRSIRFDNRALLTVVS